MFDSNASTVMLWHDGILSGITATHNIPDSKVYWANMGPIWGPQDPDGPHVGPMNFAIWDGHLCVLIITCDK